MAKKEQVDNGDEQAARLLAAWCQREGEAISKLMLKRAEWAVLNSIGDEYALVTVLLGRAGMEYAAE